MELEFSQSIKDEEASAIKNEFQQHQGLQDGNAMEEESLQEVNVSSDDDFKQEKHEHEADWNGTVDLNGMLLDGLVMLCSKEGLIEKEVAHSFLHNHSVTVDKQFIALDREDRLDQFDFALCKIHIIDHRRLVQMLLQHKPDKYLPLNAPEQPFDWSSQVRDYLKQIYGMELLNYETILERQANQYFQYWWGGPRYISPVVDPPVRFSETEEGKKLREEKENTIRIESHEEEKERTRRVNQQRATSSDLMDIAKLINSKIYGGKPIDPLPKIEGESESESKSKSHKKKSKKDKKQKKDKKKSKKKKDKKEKDIKQEDIDSGTKEASNVKEEDVTSRTSSKKSKKSKNTK